MAARAEMVRQAMVERCYRLHAGELEPMLAGLAATASQVADLLGSANRALALIPWLQEASAEKE